MNVLKVIISAIKIVKTRMDLTHVPVIVGTT